MVKIVKKNPIAIIFATYIVIEVCKVTGWVCGPPMQRFFHLTNTQLGLILSALSLGALLMCMRIGRISDQMGLWRIWKVGIIGSIASILLIFFSQGFWTVFIPLFLLGVMHVLTLNANNTYLGGAFRDNNLRVMAFASGLWFASSAISTPLLGLWVEYADRNGLGRMMFLGPYAVEALGLFAVLFWGGRLAKPIMKKADFDEKNNIELKDDQKIHEKKNVFGCFAVLFMGYCHGSMLVGIISWVNPMVQQRFQVTDFYGSLTFTGFALGLAIGRFALAGGLSNLSIRMLLGLSTIIGGVILSFAMFAPTFWITVAAIAIGGIGVSVTAPCLLALIPEQFHAIRAHMYGYLGASMCIASFITPSIIGVLADHGLGINISLLTSTFSAIMLGLMSLIWKLKG
ncbi:MAG: MFS transporter [Sedimentisphaeraceae bacterium JB056]